MAKRIFWTIILVISISAIGFAVFNIAMNYWGGNDNQEFIEETSIGIASKTTGKNKVENHNINWKKLKKLNSDVYAWIYVPDTKVDYAIVQPSKKEDDLFYLKRNLKKKYEFSGSIFSEKINSKSFKDPVTVLYGHNMLNGSMFATLHKFEDPTFFKKHKYFYIYKPGHKLTYKVYSAYTYDDRHIMNSFDFDQAKDVAKYQKSTLKPKSMTKNVRKVKLGPDSSIVTLSTCTSGGGETRYLVQGLLVKSE